MDFGLVSGEYKIVFVVRNDLKMGKGKVAAQVGGFHSYDVVGSLCYSYMFFFFSFSMWACSNWSLQADTENKS